MRLVSLCAIVGALVGMLASPTQSSPVLLTAPQRAIDRGRTMYRYDRAAWLTSDDLARRLPHDRYPEIGGWIVTPKAQGLHVDYFGKNEAAERVIYAADVDGSIVSNAVIYPPTAEPPLGEPGLAMARALRAARVEVGRHSDWRPCANARFNTIVLPPQIDGTVPVYFLTPETQQDSFPFGGHYEVDIGADGKTVSSRSFTRSCITMTKPQMRTGTSLAMMFITHTLDPQPTEIHVFEQYYLGLPVVVGIPDPRSFWKVENGTIEDVSSQVRQ